MSAAAGGPVGGGPVGGGATGPATGGPVVVDGTGMLCVTLLLHLRRRIADLPAGTTVHVVSTDPAAPLDLPAWCHLTRHEYLGPVVAAASVPASVPEPEEHGYGGREVYALRLAADARRTRPGAPWHPAGD
ncbi:sulfurtransferase TusA family protein [Kitasatospora sp. NPDC056327]|uniref:sulfurtransferase TusA family protein n=1 Tax=Kitasatospora sp. NPDC056327 TaxID=3345785 RepID=UPI0035E19156